MKIADEHISAIQSLATPRRGSVSLHRCYHSGYFVPRQFIAFTGASLAAKDRSTLRRNSKAEAT